MWFRNAFGSSSEDVPFSPVSTRPLSAARSLFLSRCCPLCGNVFVLDLLKLGCCHSNFGCRAHLVPYTSDLRYVDDFAMIPVDMKLPWLTWNGPISAFQVEDELRRKSPRPPRYDTHYTRLLPIAFGNALPLANLLYHVKWRHTRNIGLWHAPHPRANVIVHVIILGTCLN